MSRDLNELRDQLNIAETAIRNADEIAVRMENAEDRPPVEPDPPPSRPPVEPPVEPPLENTVQRNDQGEWEVLNEPDYTTYQTPMSKYPNGDWKTTYHGDPPGWPINNNLALFLAVGAYRSAQVIHSFIGKNMSDFHVMPNALRRGQVYRDEKKSGTVHPHIDQFAKMKWGFRVYDGRDSLISDAYFNGGGTSIYDDDGQMRCATKEHAIYGASSGTMEYSNLLIVDWGGQAIQDAPRPWDQGKTNAPWNDMAWMTVRDVVIKNCGRNESRASFPISIASNRQTDAADGFEKHRIQVIIERCTIESVFDGVDEWASGKKIHAKGGILVRGSSDDPDSHTYETVIVQDILFTLKDSDRAIMDFRHIKNLNIQVLDMREVTGNRKVELKHIGRLSWKGSRSMADVNIRYNGETVADGAETFVLLNGVKQ